MQNGKQIDILYKVTYIYLALPLLVFLLSWLDYGFDIGFSLFYIIGFYYAYSSIKSNNLKYYIKNNAVIISFSLALIWCFFAGIGYFYYQSFDFHFRNAVFRDLINYEWPVFYDKANTPLVYYVGFWLVPAFLTKICALFGFSQETLFIIGNVLLLFYAALGTGLVFLHFGLAVKADNLKKFLLAIIGFVFFSGLDIIGYKFFVLWEQPFDYHLDWWASIIQYSSITTSMFWVFNQFIPAALMTLLVYNERKIQNFGFLIAIMLFFAPYPTAGIGALMVAYATYIFFKTKDKISFIKKDIFSIPNLIGVFWCLPVIVLYFITNTQGIDRWEFFMNFIVLRRLLLFMLLEFLLYAFVLCFKYRKDVFFITAVISLVCIPFLRLDQQNNFCMRASQPALVLLAVFTVRFIYESFEDKKYTFLRTLLICLWLIGAVTPTVEFYRGIHYVHEAKKLNLVKDEIYTLNQSFVRMPEFGWDANHQYTAKNYRTDIFWRFISPVK